MHADIEIIKNQMDDMGKKIDNMGKKIDDIINLLSANAIGSND
jgi:hypothetical protein